ncbi:DUF805 domain-containing protein [Psittacicella hinzii]|uniref:DUF805 domain-containing protein n=1 Tax=Psittacicella hinzii TaxID=2028575 RepID=A0A3A1YC77_9GAMM|nr:DUF805 domain-containing protein [Psittacicella hinzii]RIY34976.1 hypothetical protein CKF58_07310 [Psittacicella hinzii]
MSTSDQPSFIFNFYIHLVNLFNYTGAERRREYWYFLLASFLLLAICYFAFSLIISHFGLTYAAYLNGFFVGLSTIIFFATLATIMRRLHDIGITAWVILVIMAFAPLAFIFGLMPTKYEANRYRHSPLYPED